MADHFYYYDNEAGEDKPILDETLDSARGWLKDFAATRELDLESHYTSWSLLWADAFGSIRHVQVSGLEKSVPSLGIYSMSWFDEENAPGAQRRHVRIARSFELRAPFTREMFEETLDLAVRDANATDPFHASDFCSDLTWTPGIKIYIKPRPVH